LPCPALANANTPPIGDTTQHVYRNEAVEHYIGGERMRRNVFQVLRGLHYLHTAGLVYNDMRFHNVMLDKHCNTRIIDMGMVTPAKHGVKKDAEPLYVCLGVVIVCTIPCPSPFPFAPCLPCVAKSHVLGLALPLPFGFPLPK